VLGAGKGQANERQHAGMGVNSECVAYAINCRAISVCPAAFCPRAKLLNLLTSASSEESDFFPH
jgi:hypothetical protein